MPKLTFQTTSPAEVKADVVALPMFEGPEAGPGVKEAGKALGEDLVALYKSNKLRGRPGEALNVPTFGRLPSASLLLVGLGKEKDFREKQYRNAIAAAVRTLNETGGFDGTIFLTELPVRKRDVTWRTVTPPELPARRQRGEDQLAVNRNCRKADDTNFDRIIQLVE